MYVYISCVIIFLFEYSNMLIGQMPRVLGVVSPAIPGIFEMAHHVVAHASRILFQFFYYSFLSGFFPFPLDIFISKTKSNL